MDSFFSKMINIEKVTCTSKSEKEDCDVVIFICLFHFLKPILAKIGDNSMKPITQNPSQQKWICKIKNKISNKNHKKRKKCKCFPCHWSLPLYPLTAEASPVLWEHSEGHPAQTRLLCCRLLRHGIPLLPAREYLPATQLSTLCTCLIAQRWRTTCQNRWSIGYQCLLSSQLCQYMCVSHVLHPQVLVVVVGLTCSTSRLIWFSFTYSQKTNSFATFPRVGSRVNAE